jgi:hypothetical protein
VVKYHGLARRYLMPPHFLMRPLLNGGTLARRRRADLKRDLEQDLDHDVLPEAWRWEIVGFCLERAPEDGGEPFLDLTLRLGEARRRLRFWSPSDIEIERGGPSMTSGLTIKNLRPRGLDGLGVAVDDFEATIGATRFVARTVEALPHHTDLPLVTRWLRWFELEGDHLIGETPLIHPSLSNLQTIFGVGPDNPMFDCYPVGAQNVQSVQRLVAEPIDLSRFAYFIEADAVG